MTNSCQVYVGKMKLIKETLEELKMTYFEGFKKIKNIIDGKKEKEDIDQLTKRVYEISIDFENSIDIDETSNKLYDIVKLTGDIINKNNNKNIISKVLKIAAVAVYNSYGYRTKEVKIIEAKRLEFIYTNKEEKEIINYVGFIEAIDKTLEYELMEALETVITTNKTINEELWLSIYDVMIDEYNISIGVESAGDSWVKAWNNYGKK